MEYIPKHCITAGELRAIGVKITERVPDIAWIPRNAIEFELDYVREDRNNPGVMAVGLSAQVLDVFRWVEIETTTQK